jgi:hypothetical protein
MTRKRRGPHAASVVYAVSIVKSFSVFPHSNAHPGGNFWWDVHCRYSNNTGVEIRPYKFGGLEGVAALDPQLPDTTATYATMIQVGGRTEQAALAQMRTATLHTLSAGTPVHWLTSQVCIA